VILRFNTLKELRLALITWPERTYQSRRGNAAWDGSAATYRADCGKSRTLW
jgi:hypothetical protein